MSTPEESAPFLRKSESESICLRCFQTVRADRYKFLEESESTHLDICLGSPLRRLTLRSLSEQAAMHFEGSAIRTTRKRKLGIVSPLNR